MKVCIDGLSLHKLKGTGHYAYCHNLIEKLLEMYPNNYYHLVWDDSETISEWKKFKGLKYEDIKVNRISNDYTLLERYIKANNIDVYHSPSNGFSIPENKICPYVITVHDMIALSNEEYVDNKYLKKYLSVIPKAIINASKIIAVSNFIKTELLTYFNVPEKKIEVVYPVVRVEDVANTNISVANVLKYKYNVEGPFVLYVGSLHSRKNLSALLEAFKELKKLEPDLNLVVVGKNDGKRFGYYESLLLLIKELGIEKSVVFTGYIPQKELYYFYSKCLCMIDLSEYDGFPMACVEAMSVGVPLVCSNIPSTQEVIGDACILVNPRQPGIVVNSILQVIRDNSLRNSLVESGRRQREAFNTDETVTKIVKLYESVR
jgi:glycosyltransferase involved in cell wall biosynthesis